MRFKKFKYISENWDDDFYEPIDFENLPNPEDEDEDFSKYVDYNEDDIKGLCDLIKQMFEAEDFSVEVENDDLDIIISVYIKELEELVNITDAFKIANRLENDILTMYDSSFEIYRTKADKKGNYYNIISFHFVYDGLEPSVRKNKNIYSSRYDTHDLY